MEMNMFELVCLILIIIMSIKILRTRTQFFCAGHIKERPRETSSRDPSVYTVENSKSRGTYAFSKFIVPCHPGL